MCCSNPDDNCNPDSAATTPNATSAASNKVAKVEAQKSIKELILQYYDPEGPSNKLTVFPVDDYPLPCPFVPCTETFAYDRLTLEKHIHGHRGSMTEYQDKGSPGYANCFLCNASYEEGEMFRAHLILHSRDKFFPMTKSIERIAKLYDPLLPPKEEKEIVCIRAPDCKPVTQAQIRVVQQEFTASVKAAEQAFLNDPKETREEVVKLQANHFNQVYDYLLVSDLNQDPTPKDREMRKDVMNGIWKKVILPALEELRKNHDDSNDHIIHVMANSHNLLKAMVDQFPKDTQMIYQHIKSLDEYKVKIDVGITWNAPKQRMARL